jgi:hypothetical protein
MLLAASILAAGCERRNGSASRSEAALGTTSTHPLKPAPPVATASNRPASHPGPVPADPRLAPELRLPLDPGSTPQESPTLILGSAEFTVGLSAPDAGPADPADAELPGGPPSPGCVRGWLTPPRGSPLRKVAINAMRTKPGQLFMISDMRYFVGPEDADVINPSGNVERWYVKGHLLTDPAYRRRWLIRRAKLGSGIDAVAPYYSRGYGPNTWKRVGTQDARFTDPFVHPCDRAAPGAKCMGLPREVLGCLEGT